MTDRSRLDVREHERDGGVEQRAHRTHRRTVGEHHDRDPLDAVGHQLTSDRLDIGAIARGTREHDFGDVREPFSHLTGVPRLVLGDARDHVVVELLHDSEQADPG